jgi:2-methylcitrate dehydratase PrpD
MAQKTVAEQLASMVHSISLEKLSPETIHLIKRFILDYFGCALAGSTIDSAQTMVRALMQDSGDLNECKVIGQTKKRTIMFSALLNGSFAHATELDDDHREAILHPGVVVVPTALAVSEKEGKTGAEFLEAVLAGYEVMVRVGAGLVGEAMYVGWHLTGVCGVFGAAAAAGKLLNLDPDGLTAALGIAGSMSSGLFEYKSDGSWTKRFHPGKAARSGIIAAYLAKEGFTAPSTIFEGENGFYGAYSRESKYDLNKVVANLGTKFISMDTSIKTAACCRFCQPVVDCSLDLVMKYNLKPAEVKRIMVKADKFAITLLTNPRDRVLRPQTVVDAQFSIPYAVAVSIARRKALLNEFSSTAIKDPEILELASKVEWAVEPAYEEKYPLYYPSSVTVWTTDGRELTSYIEYPKGDPENPVTDEELRDKFYELASYAIASRERIDNIYNTIFSLQNYKNVNKLAELL